jgi:hypothetical protein
MKILQNINNKTIFLNSETNFRTDLGWEDNINEFEQDTLKSIINPAENFETIRYIHKPYLGISGITQTDIWFHFYFYNNENPQTHEGGLNYEYIGLTAQENAKILREDNISFFRLEFYKVPENETPNSSNRKLVFTKHLPIPLGEKVSYIPINDYIYVPIFSGSNYKNKENMFLYWFQDDSVLYGTLISGNTFYMTAKFYNTIDGSVINFLNKPKTPTDTINEEEDIYNKMVIDKTDYSYIIYSGITGSNRIGNAAAGAPIKFYAST